MDAQNQLKKNIIHLMQQFGEKMGNDPPMAEQLEMYGLTLPQYQEGIALIMAELAEKEKARLQRVADEQEAERKDAVDNDEAEKRGMPKQDDPKEVAGKETPSVEEAFGTTPKVPGTGDKLDTSLHDLYAIQREKNEKDYNVQRYIQQAGGPRDSIAERGRTAGIHSTFSFSGIAAATRCERFVPIPSRSAPKLARLFFCCKRWLFVQCAFECAYTYPTVWLLFDTAT